MVPMEKDKRDMVMQFTTLMYFKAEETREENGYIVINDYNGMSLTSFDLDLVNCLLQTKDIFPAAAAMFITVNVHGSSRPATMPSNMLCLKNIPKEWLLSLRRT